MTMLLDGRLRDLATQTHLLETKVSSLGWMGRRRRADVEINDPRPGASHARRMRSAGRARSERKEGEKQ